MAQGWTGNKWGFSSKEKPLHFSTAELSTLNKGLHPGTPTPLTHGGGETETGKQKEPEAELQQSCLGWAALASHVPPFLCSPHPGSPCRLCRLVSPPWGQYLMPWSSLATMVPGARRRRAAGGPSGAGAGASGGSRTHTLRLGKRGDKGRRSAPRRDAPGPRGLLVPHGQPWGRRGQVGHRSWWHCQRRGRAPRCVPAELGKMGMELPWVREVGLLMAVLAASVFVFVWASLRKGTGSFFKRPIESAGGESFPFVPVTHLPPRC